MIQFTNNTIIITSQTVDTEAIYQACVSAGLDWVKKLGSTMYLISKNLYVGHSSKPNDYASYTDKNVFIQFEGNLFQVYKGSELRFGTKRANGSTTDGVSFNAPNLTLEYGFGYGANDVAASRDPQNAGNFYAYNSTINAYCFWAWFSGDNQIVEMIDCQIDGFGRVQGVNSIVKNVTIKEAHYMYGMLTPKGQLAVYENINIGQTGGLTDSAIEGCAVYFDPTFALDITITGGYLKGYEKLIYTEANPYTTTATLTFIDTQFDGVLTRLTKDAKSQVFFKYTFKPQLLAPDGTILSNVGVTIKDNTNATVYNGVSDSNGNINTALTRYKHVGASTAPIVEMNPYTMTVTYNNGTTLTTLTRKFSVTTTAINFPLYVVADSTSTGSVESGCDCTTITTAITNAVTTISNKIQTVSDASDTKLLAVINPLDTKVTNVNSNVTNLASSLNTISGVINTIDTTTKATKTSVSDSENIIIASLGEHDVNIENKLDYISTDLRQIMLTVLAEERESQTIIQQKDGSRMIL